LPARVGSGVRDCVGRNRLRGTIGKDHLKDHVATPVERLTVPKLSRIHDSKKKLCRTNALCRHCPC
jgi:hypothetical protein